MRRPLRAAVVVVAAFGFLLGPTWLGPAEAGVNPNLCESGEICLYENFDYNQGNTNHCLQWNSGVNDSSYTNNSWWHCSNNTSTDDGMNDEASSIRNTAGRSVKLCQNSSYGGNCSTFVAGAADGYLANNNVGDNSASSHQWL